MEKSKYKNLFILYILLIFSPIFQFLLKYIIKGGFIEGGNGFIVSVFRAIYEFIKYSKMIEKLKQNN